MEPDPALDPQGLILERRALVATAALGLAILLAVTLVRSRPWIGRTRGLQPPAEAERFVVYVNDDDWPTVALLPRIGRALALRIVASRQAQGRFERLADLTRVRGIGRKTVQELEPYASVDPPPPLGEIERGAHPQMCAGDGPRPRTPTRPFTP
jgi:hypothetical protein